MAVSERDRHQLFQALQGKLGPAEAETMMALLPPLGWADVATKHDIAELEKRIDLRFEATGERIKTLEHALLESFERGLKEQAHRFTMFALALNSALAVVVAGLAFAAARLV